MAVGLIVINLDGVNHYLVGQRADGGLAGYDLALPLPPALPLSTPVKPFSSEKGNGTWRQTGGRGENNRQTYPATVCS